MTRFLLLSQKCFLSGAGKETTVYDMKRTRTIIEQILCKRIWMCNFPSKREKTLKTSQRENRLIFFCNFILLWMTESTEWMKIFTLHILYLLQQSMHMHNTHVHTIFLFKVSYLKINYLAFDNSIKFILKSFL